MRRAGSSSGASIIRGKRARIDRLDVDANGRRIGRGAAEPERFGAARGRRRDDHCREPRRGRHAAGSGRVMTFDGDIARRPDECGRQIRLRISESIYRLALRLPAELTGQPGRQPDRDPRRTGTVGRRGLDLNRLDPFQALGIARGIKELGDQLAPASQPEPGAVAAARAEARVEPQTQRTGSVHRVGRGRGPAASTRRPGRGTAARAAADRRSTRGPSASRPRATDGPRREPRPIALGPACSTMRSEHTWGSPGAGKWQSADTSAVICRSGSSRPAHDDRPAGKPRDHRFQHRPQRLAVAPQAFDAPGWRARCA